MGVGRPTLLSIVRSGLANSPPVWGNSSRRTISSGSSGYEAGEGQMLHGARHRPRRLALARSGGPEDSGFLPWQGRIMTDRPQGVVKAVRERS